MIKSEDEAAAQAAHQAAASGNFMHVGSSARLLSRSPHNNNTLHGEQQLLLFLSFILFRFFPFFSRFLPYCCQISMVQTLCISNLVGFYGFVQKF